MRFVRDSWFSPDSVPLWEPRITRFAGAQSRAPRRKESSHGIATDKVYRHEGHARGVRADSNARGRTAGQRMGTRRAAEGGRGYASDELDRSRRTPRPPGDP